MSVINFVAKPYFLHQYKKLMKITENPAFYQQKTLLQLVEKARGTSFGKEHFFSAVKDENDFAKQVPVRDYADLFPYIDRMLRGEKNVLWQNIHRFSRSSGTTSGRSKFIPVSDEGLAQTHIATAKHFISFYLNSFPKSDFFNGKGIVLSGSYYTDYNFPENIDVADVSTLLYRYTDTWINFIKAVPPHIALLADWEEKLEKIARVSIPQNITNISGVATWILLLLQKVLEISGKEKVCDVWQNLELIAHGGVEISPYQKQFEKLVGKPVNYRNVYNASEGFFGFQSDAENSDLLIDIANGIYYEFECLKTQKVVPLHRVKLNENYAIIVTTNSGLWRYKIGDTVQFTQLFPHKFRISGRTTQFVNAFGEELIQANADAALAVACHKTNALITDYTVAPSYIQNNPNGHHDWLIEFAKVPENLPLFAAILDEELQRVNSDYEAKRFKNLALGCLQIHVLQQGTFQAWLQRSQRISIQAKVPRLQNNREIVDAVLAIP